MPGDSLFSSRSEAIDPRTASFSSGDRTTARTHAKQIVRELELALFHDPQIAALVTHCAVNETTLLCSEKWRSPEGPDLGIPGPIPHFLADYQRSSQMELTGEGFRISRVGLHPENNRPISMRPGVLDLQSVIEGKITTADVRHKLSDYATKHVNNPFGQPTAERPFALVVDDRDAHLRATIDAVTRMGWRPCPANSLEAAKGVISKDRDEGGRIGLIVSDQDLGRTLFQKFHMYDGYRLLSWARETDSTMPMVLHSTVFEPDPTWITIHRWCVDRARKLGVVCLAKSVLISESA